MTRIFSADVRNLYPRKLRNDETSFLPSGMRIKILQGVAYVPLAQSVREASEHTKLLFGSELYNKLFSNCLFPKRFIFKNAIVPGQRTIVLEDPIEKQKVIQEYFSLKNIPSYMIRNVRNTIFDYTHFLQTIYPNQALTRHPKMFTTGESERLMIDILNYLLNNHESSPLYFTNTTISLPTPSSSFESIVVSIPVKTKNILLFNYLKTSTTIPRSIKLNFEDLSILTLLRFILQLNSDEPFTDPVLQAFATFIEKKDVYFIFHNEKFSFMYRHQDTIEFKLKEASIYNRMLTSLKLLIKYNNKELTTEEETSLTNNPDQDHDVKKETTEKIASSNTLSEVSKTKLAIVQNAQTLASGMSVTPVKNRPKVKDVDESELLDQDDKPETVDDIEVDEEPEDDLETITDDEISSIVQSAKKTVEPKRTAAQLRRIESIKDSYKSIQFDDTRSLDEIITDAHALTIQPTKAPVKVRDESLQYSTLKDVETSYLANTYEHDLVRIVKSLNEDKTLNMHILDFKKTDSSDQFTNKETFNFVLEDENQKRHNLKFDMPKVDQDGFLKLGGNTKILKKQISLIPVAKLLPDRVIITTSYNKVFIYRQGTVLNRNLVILRRLFDKLFSENPSVQVLSGNNQKTNSEYVTSIEYDELSKIYHKVIFKNKSTHTVFFFNQKELREEIIASKLPYTFKDSILPIGIDYRKLEILDVPLTDLTTSVSERLIKACIDANVEPEITSFIKSVNIPKRRMYSRIEIQSKDVPLIVFLGALYGLSHVLNAMKVPTTFSETKLPGDPRLYIKFADGFLYYSQYPMIAALGLNGLTEVSTESYNFADFETELPYTEYMYETYKTRNLLKGWTAFKELFIDPITKEVLIDFKLPTDFLELFIYANNLLGDNSHSHESDVNIYRIRGFEIMNVLLYQAIAGQYRALKQKGRSRESLTLPQDIILGKLHKSMILENYDATNPLNELKNKSVITFKGPTGVNLDRAFSLDKRGFGESMIGVVGISTVEGGNVGIIKQLTINPRIISTRGYINTIDSAEDAKKLTFGSMATAEEAAIPFVNRHDDPKRIAFTAVQTKHVIPVSHSTPPLVGTGFEQTAIYNIGNQFAHKARHDGECTFIDEEKKFAIVEYKNGEREKISYGRSLNRNSNFFIGNNLVLDLKVGEKFKKGKVLSYNEDFFKKRSDGKHYLTQGVVARVAILEGDSTEEDSSFITETLAKKMGTTVIKRKQITISAKANIIKDRELGEYIKFGEPLIFFEDMKEQDYTTSILDVLGEIDEATLDSITRHSPKANATGKILDLRVYWTVAPAEMSASCRKFVAKYAKRIREEIDLEEAQTGKPSERRIELEITEPTTTGRVNGAEVDENGSIVIEYYIGDEHSMVPGDKLSFYSSLKSIVAHVVPKELEPFTENGERVDASIGLMSISARMVNSIYLGGFLGKIVYDVSKRIAHEYLTE